MTQTVGQRIREIAIARAKADGKPEPTAERIAADIGVSYESLRKWTTSATAPNRKRAATIAAHLGVPMSAFMLEAEPVADEPEQAGPRYSADALEIAAIFDSTNAQGRAVLRATAHALIVEQDALPITDEPEPPPAAPTPGR